MRVEQLDLPGALLITPDAYADTRGWFAETYSARRLADLGITETFVQDNHSFSVHPGTVRGLHFQAPPFAQAKLVRVTRGAVIDVAVDARAGSPTYGAHTRVELSEENRAQLYLPAGFLHGFVTMTPNVDLIYKVSDYYSAEHDGAVAWNDPDLAIDWGVGSEAATVSEKDARAPSWADFQSPFSYTPA